MKRIIFALLSAFILFGCISINRKNAESIETKKFETYKENLLNKLWETHPEWASSAGLHNYDSIIVIPDKENQNKYSILLNELNANLSGINPDRLAQGDKFEYFMIRDFIASEKWYMNEFKEYEWNPSKFNIAYRAGEILNGNYSDLTTRLKILSAFLKDAPAYYKSAIDNIKKPTYVHLQLGITQNQGALSFFNESLSDSIAISKLKEDEKKLLNQQIDLAKKAISGYIESLKILETNLSKESAKSPRLGKQLFFEKYRHDINADYTAEEIYIKALEEKQKLLDQMVVISDSIWGKYFNESEKPEDEIEMVGMLIHKISEKHIKKKEFFEEIKRQIKDLTAFINNKQLLTLDPSKPLVVRELPVYMRGTGAGASVNSPGPYEKNAKTFYNVSPLDGYSDEQAESYLREYNHYTLQILNIHEAIPGHYVQQVYANKSPSVIRSILSNGAMIEGWANYTETMMLEEGYNNSPEMWLMKHKWHLRGVTNTILDYEFHVLNMEEEEALKLMTKEAFQEITEAKNKWRRVQLSSVQLSSYFTGFTQIYALRNEIKQALGDQFNLKEFHEQFLNYGNSPVKYIRESMLKEIEMSKTSSN